MEIYTIPLDGDGGQGKFLVYRPLAGLAFVGNQAMAQLARNQASGRVIESGDAQSEARSFLQSIGFDQEDPPAPQEQERPFLPGMAVLLLTNQCQLRCTYCYAAAGEQPRQELPLEFGYAAIDQAFQNAKEMGNARYDVSFHGGGEPTYAWEALQSFIAYSRQPVDGRWSNYPGPPTSLPIRKEIVRFCPT
jgi:uncharacterized protein